MEEPKNAAFKVTIETKDIAGKWSDPTTVYFTKAQASAYLTGFVKESLPAVAAIFFSKALSLLFAGSPVPIIYVPPEVARKRAAAVKGGKRA